MSKRARHEAEQRPLPPDLLDALAELALALVDNENKEEQKDDPGQHSAMG